MSESVSEFTVAAPTCSEPRTVDCAADGVLAAGRVAGLELLVVADGSLDDAYDLLGGNDRPGAVQFLSHLLRTA